MRERERERERKKERKDVVPLGGSQKRIIEKRKLCIFVPSLLTNKNVGSKMTRFINAGDSFRPKIKKP